MTKLFFASTIVISSLVSPLCYGSEGFEYVVDNHTLALWHMNEGNGDKVADASPNKFRWKSGGEAAVGQRRMEARGSRGTQLCLRWEHSHQSRTREGAHNAKV